MAVGTDALAAQTALLVAEHSPIPTVASAHEADWPQAAPVVTPVDLWLESQAAALPESLGERSVQPPAAVQMKLGERAVVSPPRPRGSSPQLAALRQRIGLLP